MHWLFLLLAMGSLVIAMRTSSMALMVVCLLASLGLFVAWIVGWYAQRVGDGSRDEAQMIDPSELRRLRELAEARRNATPPSGEPPAL
ncbi:hypothetical protein [Pseudoxanthomonas putridarboris]|uniref:Uncharacterized protein n=1 Tax=Pseudoxanthomonas putridarboris TaxID=752605 RepID=A0ABU9IY73_9GAMM